MLKTSCLEAKKDEVVVCKNACINPLNHFPAVWRRFFFYFYFFKQRVTLRKCRAQMCFHLLRFAFKAIFETSQPFSVQENMLEYCWHNNMFSVEPIKVHERFFFFFPLVLCVNAARQHQLRWARGGFVLLETQTSSSAARWSSSAPQHRSEKETRYHLCFRTLSSLLSPSSSSFFFSFFFFLTLPTVMLGGADAFTGSITIQIVFSPFGM